MRNAVVSILLLGFLTATLSCSTKVDPKVVYKGNYRSYVKVLKEWTRTKKVYEASFDTILIVTATFESRAFRQAFLSEKIRAEALSAQEGARLLQETDEELSRKASFFLSLYTPKYKWNRLDISDPSWRLWLIDSKGKRVAPLKIEKVSKVQAALTRYYPYYDEWSSYYRVTFPMRTDQGDVLDLEQGTIGFLVAGVWGRAALEWDLS